MSVALTGIKPLCDRKFSLLKWSCVFSKSLVFKVLKCLEIVARCQCLVATEAAWVLLMEMLTLFDIFLWYNRSAVLVLNKDHLIAPVQSKRKPRGSISDFWHSLEICSGEWKICVIGPPASTWIIPPWSSPCVLQLWGAVVCGPRNSWKGHFYAGHSLSHPRCLRPPPSSFKHLLSSWGTFNHFSVHIQPCPRLQSCPVL